MSHEIAYQASPAFARRAALCYLLRQYGFPLVVVGTLGLCGAVGLLSGYDHWFCWTALLIGVAYPMLLWGYYRRSDAAYRSLKDVLVQVRFSESGVAFENVEHASTIAWSRIEKVWRFRDVWLLFFYGQNYTALPAAPLTGELRALIERNVREHGGKVV